MSCFLCVSHAVLGQHVCGIAPSAEAHRNVGKVLALFGCPPNGAFSSLRPISHHTKNAGECCQPVKQMIEQHSLNTKASQFTLTAPHYLLVWRPARHWPASHSGAISVQIHRPRVAVLGMTLIRLKARPGHKYESIRQTTLFEH